MLTRTTVALLSLLVLAACDTPEVQMVKTGSLQSCPGKTVETMVNGFMGSPKWEGINGTDGGSYVNISGDITYEERPARALVQFAVNSNTGSFQFNALEINGVPMSNLMGIGLLSKMC